MPQTDPGVIRTHNLLIWSQTRCPCATRSGWRGLGALDWLLGMSFPWGPSRGVPVPSGAGLWLWRGNLRGGWPRPGCRDQLRLRDEGPGWDSRGSVRAGTGLRDALKEDGGPRGNTGEPEVGFGCGPRKGFGGAEHPWARPSHSS